MKTLKQLTPQDVLFIGGETANVYQHTAGLVLLDPSTTGGFDFGTYREHIVERIAQVPQFHWRLHEVPLGLDLPYWVEDTAFDPDNHVRRIAVPSPGDREALADVAAYLYSRHLDRSRPLWEVWFIEGLADGRVALLQKTHHCMMDGEGAARLAEVLCDHEPNPPPQEVDPHIASARPGEVPERWRQSLNTAANLYSLPLRAGREIFGAVRHKLEKQLQGKAAPRAPQAPATSFNRDIGSERGFVFGRLSLDDIKAVKRRHDVTVNDVILAVVGGSMRQYMQQTGELPAESLRTSIAVSLRTEEDDELSNHVTMTTVTLATDLSDPVERLLAIAEDTRRAKDEAHHGGVGMMEIVQLMPPLLVNAMILATPAERVASMAGVNLIVSNVRGSDQPMYVAGARVEAIYPMSIITPGGGINITCFSYAGEVFFGATIDPALVPEPWLIVDGLADALAQYRERPKRPARKKPARKKPVRKKSSKAASGKASRSTKRRPRSTT